MQPAAQDDVALVQETLDGNPLSFQLLVERYQERVFALVRHYTRSAVEVEDIVQDTFIKVYRKLATFQRQSSFSTWLYRIAINACKDLLRKKARESARVSAEEAPDEADPHMPVEDEVALRMDVAQALSELSDDYREAVVMHDIGGVPYEDIAAITDVAIGTVKSRISRGRRQLAKLLEHRQGPGASKEQR
jgi:RNA polymerase sigma-70 factor (ECF subfamily)